MIELLVIIYLIVGILVAVSSEKLLRKQRGSDWKAPFLIIMTITIFWLPLMFVIVCMAMRQVITRITAIKELKKEMRKDVWKN